MSGYKVTEKREVPGPVVRRGVFTGKRVIDSHNHAGEKAVAVKLASGESAWGFAPTWELAESNAVDAARLVAAA